MTTSEIHYFLLEGVLRMLDLVYVFRLLDVGWDSRSVVFSDLSLHDRVAISRNPNQLNLKPIIFCI